MEQHRRITLAPPKHHGSITDGRLCLRPLRRLPVASLRCGAGSRWRRHVVRLAGAVKPQQLLVDGCEP